MRMVLILGALLTLAACQKPAQQQAANQAAPVAEAGPHKGVDRTHKGAPPPRASINDPDGGDTTLAEFAGKPVLVNLWATWCVPCRTELPTLDKLTSTRKDITVLAVSQDMADQASVEAALTHMNIANLGAYHDPKMALSGALGPDAVLPTTILYDASGKEVWRYVGDLDWTSPEAAKLLAEAGASQTH